MIFNDYKLELLKAIAEYEYERKHKLSNRRKKDVTELKAIINDSTNTTVQQLNVALLKRMDKIKTGWWIFHTGHSLLKKKLLAVINHPDNTPEKISASDLIETERKLKQMQASTVHYSQIINDQKQTLQHQQIQLRIQEKMLQAKPYYLRYEEYLINLFDKVITNQVLNYTDILQINWFFKKLGKVGESFLPTDMREIVIQKLLLACKKAFTWFLQGGSLSLQNVSPEMVICLSFLMDHYCQALKLEDANSPRLPKMMSQLIKSYFMTGASIKLNQNPEEFFTLTAFFAAIESTFIKYCHKEKYKNFLSIFNLRIAKQWQAFKEQCQLYANTHYPSLTKRDSKNLYQRVPYPIVNTIISQEAKTSADLTT